MAVRKHIDIDPKEVLGFEPADEWNRLFFRWLAFVGQRTDFQDMQARAMDVALDSLSKAVLPLAEGETKAELEAALADLADVRARYETFAARTTGMVEEVYVAARAVQARVAEGGGD